MIPSPPPPEPAPAAEAARQALVAYVRETCRADEAEVHDVEVHALGVDLSRWNAAPNVALPSDTIATGYRFLWSGDACKSRPELTLSVLDHEVLSSRMSVRPHVTVWVNAPVAAVDLKPQQDVQVTWRKVPIEKLARQPVATSGVARVSVHAGEPLTRLVVTSAPDLRNGAPVDIVFRRGALTVHADGTALADAAIGENVPVLNSATKTALQGTLIDSQTVEIR